MRSIPKRHSTAIVLGWIRSTCLKSRWSLRSGTVSRFDPTTSKTSMFSRRCDLWRRMSRSIAPADHEARAGDVFRAFTGVLFLLYPFLVQWAFAVGYPRVAAVLMALA